VGCTYLLGRKVHQSGSECYSVTSFAGNVGPGDVTGYASRTRLYLRAAHGSADVLLLGEGPGEEAIDILVQRLEAGLPEEALGLMDLPVELARVEYLRRDECPGAVPILVCHDEVVVECDAERAADVKVWLQKAMIERMEAVLNDADEVDTIGRDRGSGC
jgi:hypothetical protein